MKCYRCQKALSPSDRSCPSCGQPVYATSPGSGVALGRRVDGWLRDAPSPKDFRATPNLTSLPRDVDLRNHCGHVEDQGQIGSCVANAAVGALEYQHRKAGKPAVELSRMFVYFNARRMRGTQDRDSGLSIAEGMAAFLAYGAPPEDAWPYDPNLLTRTPDDAAYTKAAENVPPEYARVDGLENTKGALAQQFPVVFGISLPTRCYEEAGKSGVIPTPTSAELDKAKREGGHSMLLVGYDLSAGHFLVRNSWGQNWGDKGYCRIALDAFDAAVDPASTWILGKLEAFTVLRPQRKAVEGGVRDMAAKMRTEIRDGLTKDIKDSFKDIKDRVNPRRG